MILSFFLSCHYCSEVVHSVVRGETLVWCNVVAKDLYLWGMAELNTLEDSPKKWDKLGILSSAACVVHCAATPVLLYGFGSNMHHLGWLHHPVVEFGFFGLAILFFVKSFFKTDEGVSFMDVLSSSWFLWLGLSGFAVMIFGHMLWHDHSALCSVIGGSMIIGAHFLNIKHRLSLPCRL